MFCSEPFLVQGGQVNLHQRLEVAVEYGLFWPFERLLVPISPQLMIGAK